MPFEYSFVCFLDRKLSSLPTVVLLGDHEHLNGGGLRLLAIMLADARHSDLLYIYNPQQVAMVLAILSPLELFSFLANLKSLICWSRLQSIDSLPYLAFSPSKKSFLPLCFRMKMA